MADARLEDVFKLMNDLGNDYLAVSEGGFVIGLCSRSALGRVLGTRFGFALRGNARLGEYLEEESLLVRINQPIVEICQLALTREERFFHHDVILADEDGNYVGMMKACELARVQNRMVEDNVSKLQNRRAELEDMNERLVEMAERMKQSNNQLMIARDEGLQAARAKSEFLAVMSHEIRTPLNGVLGMLSLLTDSRLNDEQKELSKAASDSAEALLSILNDILDFSRLDSGKIELERREFGLRDLAESVVSLMSESAQESEVEIFCDVCLDTPSKIWGDTSRLRQVLVNLLGNAVKFTKRGEVDLTIRKEGSEEKPMLRFEVSDTGIGISEESQKRLFQPFVQADSSMTRRFGGTGLGLAICQRLVRVMGGTIGVNSEVGKGSTFWFTLPFSPEEMSRYEPVSKARGKKAIVSLRSEKETQVVAGELNARGISVTICADIDCCETEIREGKKGEVVLIAEEDRLDEFGFGTQSETPRIFLRPSHSCPREVQDERIVFLRRPLRPSQLDRALEQVLAIGDETPREEATGWAAAGEALGENESRLPKLLLVEDHEINRRLASKLLAKLGYQCDVAEDGLIALDRVRQREYPLILLDCQMPRMDGYEFAGKLRELEQLEAGRISAHVVALTANAMSGDRELCLAAGMDDYVTKPLKKADLKAAIERGLGRETGRFEA
ncbi:MAG: ATP-binding protein [Verrucomicrobiota bacterium]